MKALLSIIAILFTLNLYADNSNELESSINELSYDEIMEVVELKSKTNEEELFVLYLNAAIKKKSELNDELVQYIVSSHESFRYYSNPQVFFTMLKNALNKSRSADEYVKVFPNNYYIGNELHLLSTYRSTKQSLLKYSQNQEHTFKVALKVIHNYYYNRGSNVLISHLRLAKVFLDETNNVDEYLSFIQEMHKYVDRQYAIYDRQNTLSLEDIAVAVKNSFDHFESFEPSTVEIEKLKSILMTPYHGIITPTLANKIENLQKYGPGHKKGNFLASCKELIRVFF